MIMDANAGGNTPELSQTIDELRHAERIQKALYQIADLAGSEMKMDDALKRLHHIIAELMYAENFYIILYDAQHDSVRFRYFVDSDTRPSEVSAYLHSQGASQASQPELAQAAQDSGTHGITRADIPLRNIEYSLTWYVIRHGRPLRGSLDQIEQALPGPLKSPGATSRDWLGVPMIDGTEVKGLLVSQSYEREAVFSQRDQDLLSFVASHVLTMLQRRQTRKDLEQAVIQRTQELAETNQALKEEVALRRQNERLQRALYHIAEQAGESSDERDFFALVHREVSRLLYAENFFVALLVDDDTALEFGYYADEFRTSQTRRPLARGLTEYALRSHAGVLLSRADIEALIKAGEVKIQGPNAYAWLGVPLQCEGRVLGLVAVQSYRADCHYEPRDLELLRFVSRQIASTLERKRALASLKEAKATLEQRVAERTQALSAANTALARQSATDPLTGLHNRRYLSEQIPKDIALISRQFERDSSSDGTTSSPSTHLLFLMLDLDHFKQINDEYGHAAGDSALKQVSEIIMQCIRESDIAVRWGGEEFLLVARFTDADFAPKLAERVRKMVAEHAFSIGHTQPVYLTCSIGFAQYPFFPSHPSRVHWEEVINIADNCLLAAKKKWRNAWIGMHPSARATLDPPPAKIATEIPKLIEEGLLEVYSSRPDPTGLIWP